MPCVAPLAAWFSKTVNETGKRSLVFDGSGDLGKPVDVPCGQCIGCRLEYARDWAVRCMHEASLHDENCFITLTYKDDELPKGASLDKKHCQDFLKRLRSRFDTKRIRYYLAGEYGDANLRPHYHACMFGFDFPDKKYWSTREGNKVWTSDKLEETWSHGRTEVGSCTFESAAYVARYMVKKFKGPKEVMEKYYDGLEPEFALMSRGGKDKDGKQTFGIAHDYYKKHGTEIHSHDSIIVNGREQKPPKYYDSLFEKKRPVLMASIKEERKYRAIAANEKDGRGSARLSAEEKLMNARVKLRQEQARL